MDKTISKKQVWYQSDFSIPNREKIVESLPNSLAKIAELFPNRVALLCDEQSYSFTDLVNRVAGLADEINAFADGYGPVALVQSIGFDSIAAWFACALSGRPFLLLEPDHPPKRLREIIEHANCSLVLMDHKTSLILLNLSHVKILISDGRKGILKLDAGLRPTEPTMIFPTSGSTGKPKLVTYSAVTILVKVHGSIQLMKVPDSAKVLIAGSHGNYGFLHHALVFLLSGGTICLEDVKARGFSVILQAINQLGARHVRFTPSMFRKFAALPQAKETLRLLDAVRFSGEPLLMNDIRLAHSVLKPECLIQNIYGSTESALFIWSSAIEKINFTESTVPIGKIYPLSSYSIRTLEDIGDDTTGELLIRSKFHALGDLQDGIINGERFLFSEDFKEERIYSTGDIVRSLPDGNLIHLGRSERMVKVRGNRVFLTEVENQLRNLPGVTGAVVVDSQIREDIMLFGFITTDSVQTSENVLLALSGILPDFMIPRSIICLSEIPLMPGGKVDYIALKAKIPQFDNETYSDTGHQDNYRRLIQLWDSILWNGAHKQNADFLALGGDSLSFMILVVEVERIFEKKLDIEEFRAKSTLGNLAELLGIQRLSIDPKIRESLQVRLLLPSLKPSKGIALGIPGYWGSTHAFPFRQAGLFDDYDIWVADFIVNKGSLSQNKRWWRVANELVEGIQKGEIPLPRIIFGYSFGGGLAWLISRLLARIVQFPIFVVMVDAIPLHRLKPYRNNQLKKALELVSTEQAPPTLHIQREPLSDVWFGVGSTNEWESSDNIQSIVHLPTVDHLEMARWNILALASDAVTNFLNQKPSSNPWKPSLPPPTSFGVQIHNAINGDPTLLKLVTNEFIKHPEKASLNQLITLVIFLHFNHEDKMSKQLIRNSMDKWGNYVTVQYLFRRIQRELDLLLSDKIPPFYPMSIISIEASLGKKPKEYVTFTSHQKRLFIMAYDVFLALLAAFWSRFKRMLLNIPKQ
ncbi:non-ribosomal peptide synthetase [Aquirufa sp. ROCK-SH2]